MLSDDSIKWVVVVVAAVVIAVVAVYGGCVVIMAVVLMIRCRRLFVLSRSIYLSIYGW